MGKPAKSQWDFGELFAPGQTRRVLSVSELTTQVRRLLEKQVGVVWVSGEITNFRAQASGHIYFTLKDAGSQVSCVLFRGAGVANREMLADGQKILVQGELTVYEPRGQYQLLVRAVELQGIGALQLKFEQLKQKLAAQGWFAPERKRPLPRYVQSIGLVTSPSGAAVRDVLHVVHRRHPGLEIVLAPCRVQGEGAAAEIAAAIGILNEAAATAGVELDLILVTRGGGSLEDLWAFNEETVARAIFDSKLPVVSAVGHEIDFTIADFVADLRAATPSAAAELITEGMYASREFLIGVTATLTLRVKQQLEQLRDNAEDLSQRMLRVHPRRRLEEHAQRLDDLGSALFREVQRGSREQLLSMRSLMTRLQLVRPQQVLKQKREALQPVARQLGERVRQQWREAAAKLSALDGRLRLLGPEQVLARGYSITQDARTGTIIRDASQVKTGQLLKTRLKTGELESRVEG